MLPYHATRLLYHLSVSIRFNTIDGAALYFLLLYYVLCPFLNGRCLWQHEAVSVIYKSWMATRSPSECVLSADSIHTQYVQIIRQ
jgi:hypothetical protein